MDELRKAVEDAWKEIEEEHRWSMDESYCRSAIESTFYKVVLKHLQPLVDPGAAEIARRARIAALRSELAELEKKHDVEEINYSDANSLLKSAKKSLSNVIDDLGLMIRKD